MQDKQCWKFWRKDTVFPFELSHDVDNNLEPSAMSEKNFINIYEVLEENLTSMMEGIKHSKSNLNYQNYYFLFKMFNVTRQVNLIINIKSTLNP